MLIMGIVLAISLAGNVLLSKLYVGAKQDTARVQQAYDSFKVQVKVLGEQQEKDTAAKIMQAKNDKEKADAENVKKKSDLAGLYAAYRSLRDQRSRAGGSLLPAAAPGSPSPQSITLDRETLDRGLEAADGVLQEGATRILQRGDTAIVDLNTARTWAAKRGGP
jgi:hypothetical protein